MPDDRALPPSAPRRGAPADATPRVLGRRAKEHAAEPKPEPRVPAWADVPLGWRIADAYLAVVGVLLLEILIVGVLARRELTGVYEVGLAVRTILPIAGAIAAPLAVVAALVIELSRHARARAARAALVALSAGAAAAAAWGVSTGRHFQSLWARGGFVLATAAVVGAVVWLVAPRVGSWLARPKAAWPTAGAALVAVVALDAINARVLPRLYPAFHRSLAVLALMAGAFACLPMRQKRAAGRSPGEVGRAAAALVLFAGAAAASATAPARLALLDNVRVVWGTGAPIVGHAVELATRLAPAPPLADVELAEVAPSGPVAVDLSGRDFLLITIDALRADHVGAYGYRRATTPNLDALAAEGVVFEAAYTATPHTSYAITSLMTGKFTRPLVALGLGDDSETWAAHLVRYGYRTAAFYPPAVFFVDGDRFAAMRDRGLDFEYRKVEFATAEARVEQVRAYLDAIDREPAQRRLFLWVHLFEPHEPYEAHPETPFGDRDIDRYDAEIAAADRGLGAIVKLVRERRPRTVVIATADHGEEFLDHGGRYHGTTTYDEQARVPLVISAPGAIAPRRVPHPVSLVDLLPTVLSSLAIPRPARLRGFDLGPLIAGTGEPPPFAFAESETQTMLAKATLRLVCERRLGTCSMYDMATDPGQREDVSRKRPAEAAELRAELVRMEGSHGKYELRGLRAEGKSWPEALRRGLAGDGEAAVEIAGLLDDADLEIRRKAAEVLFELRRKEAAAALRLAVVRDDDEEVRRWAALALTRLGEGASLTRELLTSPETRWRRLAALALAESGDDRGEDVLVAWWREAWPAEAEGERRERVPIPFDRALEIAEAFARIRSKAAVVPLLDALSDVRLRPHLARALATIGDDTARPALAVRLASERYQTARVAMAEALVKLGAGPELRGPLVRFLGTPDPLPGGLGMAMAAGVLDIVGGPRSSDRSRLEKFATSGVRIGVVVPKPPSRAARKGGGTRVICRARAEPTAASPELRLGLGREPPRKRDERSPVPRSAPVLDPQRSVRLDVPATGRFEEPFATLPDAMGIAPGDYVDLVVYATHGVEVKACAVVPLTEELPPPPPEPWQPKAAGSAP